MTVSVDIHSANDLAIWLDVYKDNLETSRDLDQRIRSFDFERIHICSDLRKRKRNGICMHGREKQKKRTGKYHH